MGLGSLKYGPESPYYAEADEGAEIDEEDDDDAEDEEEEEGDEPIKVVCDHCLKSIHWLENDEVVQLVCKEPVISGQESGGIQFNDFLTAQTKEIVFAPLVLHVGCYEEMIDWLLNEITEAPDPIDDPSYRKHEFFRFSDGHRSNNFKCKCCKEKLIIPEPIVMCWQGEFKGAYGENGEIEGLEFENQSKRCDFICTACFALIEDGFDEFWTLSFYGECPRCTRLRCWRFGECLCDCHEDE